MKIVLYTLFVYYYVRVIRTKTSYWQSNFVSILALYKYVIIISSATLLYTYESKLKKRRFFFF